jgi:hypothetical protein
MGAMTTPLMTAAEAEQLIRDACKEIGWFFLTLFRCAGMASGDPRTTLE